MELYADYVAFSRSDAPLNFQKRGVIASWELLDLNPHRGVEGHPWSRFSTIWWATWRWILKYKICSIDLAWGVKAPVQHVGYSLRCPHLNKRPLLACKQLAFQGLWRYFNPENGRRRNTSSPLIHSLFD